MAERCAEGKGRATALIQLSRQLLSPQQHYDWGLRALKTILRVGGQLMRRQTGLLGWVEEWPRHVLPRHVFGDITNPRPRED